jgi:flagella basal body P-ring formation protein FlgA
VTFVRVRLLDSRPALARGAAFAAALLTMLALAPAALALPAVVSPSEAIRRAVEARFGGEVAVVVTSIDTDVAGDAQLVAVPDPAARTGRKVRFELVVGHVRAGAAVASVTVQARYAQAAHAIARDHVLTRDDIAVVDGELRDVAFMHLPSAEELVGMRARRAIAPGEALTEAVVDVPPVVKSGDRVIVAVRIGPVQAERTGVASGSGRVGDTIRVMEPGMRRLIPARIVAAGRVEVIQ